VSRHQELANKIWSVADLLRGDYKQSEYGRVILPFTVLRRLDCVMTPDIRAAVRAVNATTKVENKESLLQAAAGGQLFYNVSLQDFSTIRGAAQDVKKNLTDYIDGFSSNALEIIDKFDFRRQIERLDAASLLYKVLAQFQAFDLSPTRYDNHAMGYVFEELIRRFSEASNETAGEHFTPREVIDLMVDLLLAPDRARLADPGQVINILDPACGTGGMLSAAEDRIIGLNPDHPQVFVFGQELNPESYAICRADLMIKGHDPTHVVLGNSFSDDGHEDSTFDYLLANPPFGVEWKKVKDEVEKEARQFGHNGRFGAGLPRINDGSLLFLQHMISKMQPVARDGTGGSRVAIVFNGSPLFTGAAWSGESEIRRWILERDLLEAVIALPDQLFYNTGISTYVWILSNRKDKAHKGKVILLDARDQWTKMRKSLGEKRKQITKEQITFIGELYAAAPAIANDPAHPDHHRVKQFRNEEFGYQRITVDRPLKLRFEIGDDTIEALRQSTAFADYDCANDFIEAIKPSLGGSWRTKQEAANALHAAVAEAGVPWPTKTPILKAVWAAVGVPDPDGEIQMAGKTVVPDPDLRDYENVPLGEDIDAHLAREVLPHVPDAWIADIKVTDNSVAGLSKGDVVRYKIGYEIPFTRYFYAYTPPRPVAEIGAELREIESRIQELIKKVTA
jgi:type I restriction enzyme M protein